MATTDDSIKKNISHNITKYRENAGLSQKELASRLNVTPSRISNWEQGANCPTIEILFEVCKILNVSINDIYGIYPDLDMKLSYEERKYLEKYRVLDPHGKEMVDFTLQKEWERSTAENSNIIEYDSSMPNAAHDRTDKDTSVTEKQHDENIMDDKDF